MISAILLRDVDMDFWMSSALLKNQKVSKYKRNLYIPIYIKIHIK